VKSKCKHVVLECGEKPRRDGSAIMLGRRARAYRRRLRRTVEHVFKYKWRTKRDSRVLLHGHGKWRRCNIRIAYGGFRHSRIGGWINAFVSISFNCLQYHNLSIYALPPLILVAGKIPIAALAGRPSTAKPSTQNPTAMQKHCTQYTQSHRRTRIARSHKFQNTSREEQHLPAQTVIQ
jgi:hypothetical protein